jgi:hypothetical protein
MNILTLSQLIITGIVKHRKAHVICKNVEIFKKFFFQKKEKFERKYNIYKNIQQFYLSTCNLQIKLIIGQTYVELAFVL